MGRDKDGNYTHPLFRTGLIPLASSDSQDNVQYRGFYNPVVDGIGLWRFDDEVVRHEVTHRVFSTFGAGFEILRVLAGVSHSLIFVLVDTLHQQKLKLKGTDLMSLEVSSRSKGKYLGKIIDELRALEILWDTCYWSLLPVAEIAAIDFAPPKGSEGWYVQRFRDTDAIQKNKQMLIRATAKWLEDHKNPLISQIFGDVIREFHDTWEVYNTIQDNEAREYLLKFALSSSLQLQTTDLDSLVTAHDSLRIVYENVSRAQQSDAAEFFQEAYFQKSIEVFDHIDAVIAAATPHIPTSYRGPIYIAHMIHCLLLYSHPFPLNPISPKLYQSDEPDTDSPAESLLFIWVDQNSGRCYADLNARYLHMADVFAKDKPPLLRELGPLPKEWWRFTAGFETIRQALKDGSAVTCPFLNVGGVDCSEDCPIAALIGVLQDHSDIKGEICAS